MVGVLTTIISTLIETIISKLIETAFFSLTVQRQLRGLRAAQEQIGTVWGQLGGGSGQLGNGLINSYIHYINFTLYTPWS